MPYRKISESAAVPGNESNQGIKLREIAASRNAPEKILHSDAALQTDADSAKHKHHKKSKKNKKKESAANSKPKVAVAVSHVPATPPLSLSSASHETALTTTVKNPKHDIAYYLNSDQRKKLIGLLEEVTRNLRSRVVNIPKIMNAAGDDSDRAGESNASNQAPATSQNQFCIVYNDGFVLMLTSELDFGFQGIVYKTRVFKYLGKDNFQFEHIAAFKKFIFNDNYTLKEYKELAYHEAMAECYSQGGNQRHGMILGAQNEPVGFDMSYLPGLTLEHLHTLMYYSPRDYDLGFRLEVFQEIVKALLIMSYKGVVHADVKPENIFLNFRELLNPWDQRARFCDFGFARLSHGRSRRGRGSLPFAAPEIFLRLMQTGPVDSWALGIIFFGLFSTIPFPNMISQIRLKGQFTWDCKTTNPQEAKYYRNVANYLINSSSIGSSSLHPHRVFPAYFNTKREDSDDCEGRESFLNAYSNYLQAQDYAPEEVEHYTQPLSIAANSHAVDIALSKQGVELMAQPLFEGFPINGALGEDKLAELEELGKSLLSPAAENRPTLPEIWSFVGGIRKNMPGIESERTLRQKHPEFFSRRKREAIFERMKDVTPGSSRPGTPGRGM